MGNHSTVTRLLGEIRQGKQEALKELLPLVYDELHRMARSYFRRERSDHTLQPTALVHEAYMRMEGQRAPIQNRGHFLAVAATQMRRILLDYARRHRRRGGQEPKLLLEDTMAICGPRPLDIIDLDAALSNLASLDPKLAQLVELRFFAGLSVEETAEVLGVSAITVKRGWRSARAFLRLQMAGGASDPGTLGEDPADI